MNIRLVNFSINFHLSKDSHFPGSMKHHGNDLHNGHATEISNDRESATHNNFV